MPALNAFTEFSEQLLIGRAFELAANPVALLDRGARVIWSNNAYVQQVERWRPAGSVKGKPTVSVDTSRVCRRLQATLGPAYRALWENVNRGGTWSGEVSLERPHVEGLVDEPDAMFDCIISPLPDVKGRPAYFLVLLHDVTEHHQQKMQHAHASHHDMLTGLGNRMQLQERATTLLAQSKPFALFYMDLDGFKGVNDTFGHAMGDEVLKGFSSYLKEVCRDSDLPIRLGGDEFVLLLSGTSKAEILQVVADRILRDARGVFTRVDAALEGKVGVSIGGSSCPENGRTLEELLAAADYALYQVKRSGKGSFAMKDPSHAASA